MNLTTSILTISRRSSSHVRPKAALIAAIVALIVAWGQPASAQNTYTWTSGTTGGAWTTSANWTVSPGPGTIPGAASTDTATLGNVTSASRIVSLGSNETIGGLTFAQTTAGSVNELDIQGTGSASTTLTVGSTLALTATTGTALLFLDNTVSTNTGDAQYNGNISVGANGILEMSALVNGSTTKTSNITGNVTVNSGGTLNVELPVQTGGFDGSFINGSLTLSGGTLDLGKTTAASGGVTLAGTGVRFAETSGSFTANSGSVITATSASTTNVMSLQFGGSATGATFNSGVTGSFFTAAAGATNITLNGNQSSSTGASVFTLASDIALPSIAIAPTTTTNNTVNYTLGTVTAGNTLSIVGLSVTPGANASGTTKAGAVEVTLGSNVTLGSGNNVTFSGLAGSTTILNMNGFTLNQAGHSFSTAAVASNYTLEGGGTLSATAFSLSGNTGANGTSVSGTTTLQAVGVASATINNLGNSAGTIDPLSTFLYTGTASGTNVNSITSNRSIGRLAIGNGSAASILDIATAALPVGADVTVKTASTLDLNGFGLTEKSVSGATAGGLNGAGTVQNSAASTTATLTLDATGGNGSFSGTIKDNGGTGGITAVAMTGGGTQTFSSANTYSGGTIISGGNLAVTNSTGTATGTGNVTVGGVSGGSTTATLSGTGTVAGLITSSASGDVAHISPGTGGTAGTLHVGSLGFTIGAGTNFDYVLSSSTSGANDLIAMGGTLTVGGSGIVFNFSGGTFATTGSYTLISGATGNSGFLATDFSATGIGSDTAIFSLSGNNLVVSFSAPSTNTTGTYTLTTTAGAGVLHVGASTTLNTTLANVGGGTADSLNVTGLGASSTGGTVNNGTVNSSTPVVQTGTLQNSGQTFTASTVGSQTVTGTVTSVTGANGSGAATQASDTGASVFVYSGQGVWNTNGGGSWGAVQATPVNWTANGGTPGLDSNFKTTDSATFGTVVTSGTATVTLGNDSPFLNAITFNNSAASYDIEQGAGGTGVLHLDSTSTATVTVSAGSHTIGAPIELDSNAATSVATSSTLTISGNISQSGTPSLAIAGPGTTILSGSNTYSGGTSVGSGTLLLSNANGSATGTGALTVGPGATIGGYGSSSGTSFSISGASTSNRANVLVGLNSATDTNTSQVLTLVGSGTSSIQNANLAFNINAGSVGQGTQLNVGSTAIAFGTGAQSTTLTLNLQGAGIIPPNSDYVLIAGTSGATTQYSGLDLGTSTVNGDVTITQILNSGSGGTGDLTLALTGLANTYYGANSSLFLYQNSTTGADDIEVEVVPEPGTWAMMLGGLAFLVFWQRRRGASGNGAKSQKVRA